MSDLFTGRWLVSEYVFNPDGSFAGVIRQQRQLELQPDGRLRVFQRMHVEDSLFDHPMGRFAGEWVFDLERGDTLRHYHGVDVVGVGVPFGESAMLGSGVWTRFGHNFTSFAIMPHPHRQITGGKFYNAHALIANIIGIATPERHDAAGRWEGFSGTDDPRTISLTWSGSTQIYDAHGSPVAVSPLTRTYEDKTIHEQDNHAKISTTRQRADIHAFDVRGNVSIQGNQTGRALYGRGMRYGWLQESVSYTAEGTRFESAEILDNDGACLVIVRRWWQGEQLTHIQTAILRVP